MTLHRLMTRSETNRAVVYLASANTPTVELGQSLDALCSRFAVHAARYDLVLAHFPGELPVMMDKVPVACHTLFRRVRTVEVDALAQSPKAAQHFVGNVEQRGYKLMIWFWLHAILKHPAFAEYHYVLRLDSDSVFLTDVPLDPVEELVEAHALIGYHCFAYEYEPFVSELKPFVRQFLATNAHTPAASNFTLPTAETVGLFYTNFLVMDRAQLAEREDILRFMEAASEGVVRYRWGDAPLWGLVAGLFLQPADLLHLNSFGYQHARQNRFITLPGNREHVDWDFDRWKAESQLEPIGHCFDRRIPLRCIHLARGHLQDDDCPKPYILL